MSIKHGNELLRSGNITGAINEYKKILPDNPLYEFAKSNIHLAKTKLQLKTGDIDSKIETMPSSSFSSTNYDEQSASALAIALICDNNYVMPTVVAIASIIKNKKKDTLLDIFVVTADLSDRNTELFYRLNTKSVRINVRKASTEGLPKHTYVAGRSRAVTPSAMLKFRLPEIIDNYNKVLYLDGDVIVREDLSWLYNQDIGDYFLSAVEESSSIYHERINYPNKFFARVKNYFNSGVMLLNLEKMRKESATEKLIACKKELTDSFLVDQDQLNIVFNGKVKLLPIRYNLQYINLNRVSSHFTIEEVNKKYNVKYASLYHAAKDAAILHFSSKDKPWISASAPLSDEWYSYFMQAKLICPDILLDDTIHYDGKNNLGNDAPKVSVVMPCYNVGKYITDSLNCVLHQTLTDIQIICVNDGSDDRTLEILKIFAMNDDRIEIISQHNQGLSAARNAGLSACAGKYVYFFDSDDKLEEDALEILYNHASNYNLQKVLFDGISFFENEALEAKNSRYKTFYQRSQDYTGIYKGDELFVSMTNNGDYVPSACLQFFERKYLVDNRLRFKVGILHEDNLFAFQSMLLCERVSHLRLNLFHRRVRENSIMSSKEGVKNYLGYYACCVEMLGFLFQNQHKISDLAITIARRQISVMQKHAYRIYQSLPVSQRYQPQFLDPLLHVVSSVMYYPLTQNNSK